MTAWKRSTPAERAEADAPAGQDVAADRLAAARETALRLLARREHSALELAHKLRQRDYPQALIDTLCDQLSADGWLSDARFAEVYSRARADKGYGPLRVRAELRERGVDDELVAVALAELDADWPAALARLAAKRFGRRAGDAPPPYHERARQTRFLRQRGFSLAQIDALYRSLHD